MRDLAFTLPALAAARASGTRPSAIIAEAYRRLAARDDPGIFLHLADKSEAMAAADAADPALPLAGIPFAVKDNIDVAGMPTTAACPALTYTPDEDAVVVARLKAAGAIVIGKTNLDQFATGLNGTRTPFPVPRNAVDDRLVPGGSSAGSAVAVGAGIVPFSLGTDTAGSGRVPAALNGIVGLKPTLGALSTTGVVPACRTLDAVSIFANTIEDAHHILALAAAFDDADPYSRPIPIPPPTAPEGLTLGVPQADTVAIHGGPSGAGAFAQAITATGAKTAPFDFAPFAEIAALLYAGAPLAERLAVIEPFLTMPDAVHPVTRQVVEKAATMSAVDAVRDHDRLKTLARAVAPIIDSVDALMVPTIPAPCTLEEIEADPIGANNRLGTYTNFVNLLDLCALAVPFAGTHVTLIARKGEDSRLAGIAAAMAGNPPAPALGPGEMALVVCGAHMSGLPLNGQLTERGGRLLQATTTAPAYRLLALPGGPPARPGLIRVAEGGGSVAVEVWALPLAHVGSFLAGIPAPLGIGTVALEDGSAAKGFLCEAVAEAGAQDITHLKSWRNFVTSSG
ncbi:MAG: allophanate hydrolase [Pseudomonadota bacterium]